MAVKDLLVTIQGVPCGIVHQNESGGISFAYFDDYEGVPLSLTMPVSNRTYGQRVLSPYLFGLLPDNQIQREAIAREFDVHPNNPVSLLSNIGRDCPGAVQFFPCDARGEVQEDLLQPETYRPLSEHEIALRLKDIKTSEADSWIGKNESWSLGGNQGKFALARIDGQWCSCEGRAATTHIFKNGVRGFMLEALNEFVCMRAARKCGIPVADVSYSMFEDEPALVVERYDRMRSESGRIIRIHQEDCCQALGCMPNQKYTMYGGPTTVDMLKLLDSTSEAAINLRTFTYVLFYNYAIGAPDAHAKNYSLLLGRDGAALLAKMYDVTSGLCYEELKRKGRLAMAIGGENRFGRVGAGAIARYAGKNDARIAAIMERAGLDAQECADIMAWLAQRVPKAMEQVIEESASLAGIEELRLRLLKEVCDNCERTLALL